MFCGLGFFGMYTWVLACYENMTVGELKNIVLIAGILVLVAIIEVVWEVKKGFKLIFSIPKKIFFIIKNKISNRYKKWKCEKIKKKISLGKFLTNKEVKFYQNLEAINVKSN